MVETEITPGGSSASDGLSEAEIVRIATADYQQLDRMRDQAAGWVDTQLLADHIAGILETRGEAYLGGESSVLNVVTENLALMIRGATAAAEAAGANSQAMTVAADEVESLYRRIELLQGEATDMDGMSPDERETVFGDLAGPGSEGFDVARASVLDDMRAELDSAEQVYVGAQMTFMDRMPEYEGLPEWTKNVDIGGGLAQPGDLVGVRGGEPAVFADGSPPAAQPESQDDSASPQLQAGVSPPSPVTQSSPIPSANAASSSMNSMQPPSVPPLPGSPGASPGTAARWNGRPPAVRLTPGLPSSVRFSTRSVPMTVEAHQQSRPPAPRHTGSLNRTSPPYTGNPRQGAAKPAGQSNANRQLLPSQRAANESKSASRASAGGTDQPFASRRQTVKPVIGARAATVGDGSAKRKAPPSTAKGVPASRAWTHAPPSPSGITQGRVFGARGNPARLTTAERKERRRLALASRRRERLAAWRHSQSLGRGDGNDDLTEGLAGTVVPPVIRPQNIHPVRRSDGPVFGTHGWKSD